MLHVRLSLVTGALVRVGLDDALLVLAQTLQLFQLDLRLLLRLGGALPLEVWAGMELLDNQHLLNIVI